MSNPQPTLNLLETLKNDTSLYVRRSVANHVGDIVKDHPEVAFSMCERWLNEDVSKDLSWLICHALRHPAKKGDARALKYVRQQKLSSFNYVNLDQPSQSSKLPAASAEVNRSMDKASEWRTVKHEAHIIG